MNNKLLNKKLLDNKQKKWDEVLNRSLSEPLLKNVDQLPEYYRTYTDRATIVAVIPALGTKDEKSRSYYSCPIDEKLEIEDRRLAPAFLFDNSQLFKECGEQLFELSEGQPNFWNEKNNDLFLFDSEESNLYFYKDFKTIKYEKGILFEDMKRHILANPYAVIFQGCDDGHVGCRFCSKDEMYSYLNSLEVFEDVFKNESKYNDNQTLIKLKKENPEQSLSELFKGNIESHN